LAGAVLLVLAAALVQGLCASAGPIWLGGG